MSHVLGYVPAGTAAPDILGVALSEEDEVSKVIDCSTCGTTARRLEKAQACFRSFAAFLPHCPGIDDMLPAQILALTESLAGHGQLSFVLPRAGEVARPETTSGRAHLRACRARRKAQEDWEQSSASALNLLAEHLPTRQRRLTRRGRTLVYDLLLPLRVEAELPMTLEHAVQAAQQSAPLTCLAVSGLWAPFSFATNGAVPHE